MDILGVTEKVRSIGLGNVEKRKINELVYNYELVNLQV